ncbi:MAG TPA: hypothetical protein VG297_10465 [Bryobacteraceae bacterium]|jgi:uncharacterized protein (TIGR03437 family)|nr:hypothetical protein [Bryobacteraceae bacterium]
MSCFRFATALIVCSFALIANAAAASWVNLGGTITGRPAATKNVDGRLEVFARNSDNTLGHIVENSPGTAQWSAWSSLGGPITSDPAVGVNKDGRLEVFALGTDNAIWHTAQLTAGGAGWSGWSSLGGQGVDDPTVIANADGRLEVVIHTATNSMWHVWQTSPGGSWSAGDEIMGAVDRPPFVSRNSDGRLIIFAGDSDGKDWWTIQNTAGADSWSSWFCLLGGTVSAPVIGTNSDGRLQLFSVRSDGSVWTSSQTAAGGYDWTDWSPLGGSMAGDVAVVSNPDGRLVVYGRGTDNTVWQASQSTAGGSAWSNWQSLGGAVSATPAVAADSNGVIQVFATGTNNSLWTIGQASAGGAPSIGAGGAAVPVWSGATTFSSNMYFSIYGSNLSGVTQPWDNAFNGGAAPTSLGGVSVTVNNIPAFIEYVSPTQINIDAPDDTATGPVNIVVQNAAGSTTATATRARLSPTLLTVPQFDVGSKNYVVAQTPDFQNFIRPGQVTAKPGDTVIVFATGCGPTNPATRAGVMAAQNSPLALPYQVKIGGVATSVSFAGVVAGTVGLYQLNIVIPNVASGDQTIELIVDGVSNGQGLLIPIG